MHHGGVGCGRLFGTTAFLAFGQNCGSLLCNHNTVVHVLLTPRRSYGSLEKACRRHRHNGTPTRPCLDGFGTFWQKMMHGMHETKGYRSNLFKLMRTVLKAAVSPVGRCTRPSYGHSSDKCMRALCRRYRCTTLSLKQSKTRWFGEAVRTPWWMHPSLDNSLPNCRALRNGEWSFSSIVFCQIQCRDNHLSLPLHLTLLCLTHSFLEQTPSVRTEHHW